MNPTDRPPFAPLGSIISGTTREEDLIPAFEDAIHVLTGTTPERPPAVTKLLDEDDGFLDTMEWLEVSEYLNETLHDALNALAPPYCSFGDHPGDGADFGYWPDWDSLREAIHDGFVVQLDAGDEWPELADDVDAVLENNDHGNATLYDRKGNELWSVV